MLFEFYDLTFKPDTKRGLGLKLVSWTWGFSCLPAASQALLERSGRHVVEGGMQMLAIVPDFDERHQRPRRKDLFGEQFPLRYRKEILGDRVDAPMSVKRALAPLRRWAATA